MKQNASSGTHYHRHTQRKHLDGAELIVVSNEANVGTVIDLPKTVDELTQSDRELMLRGTPRYLASSTKGQRD